MASGFSAEVSGQKQSAQQFKIARNPNQGQGNQTLASVKDQKIQDRAGLSWNETTDKPAQATVTDEFVASIRTMETAETFTPVSQALGPAASRLFSRGQQAYATSLDQGQNWGIATFKSAEASVCFALSGAKPEMIAKAKSEARTTAISNVRASMDETIAAGERQRVFT